MHVETIAADAATEARADVVLSGRALRDAVKLLSSKAADKRATIPILASIYFQIAPDGRATLTATDLTAWASLTLQALSDDVTPMPGAFALEGAALHKVLSKAGKAERIRLTVNTDATRVRLKTGRIEMHLRAVADEFPLAPISAFAAERAGELSRAQLMADLAALAPAMSDEYGRQHLHGIAMQTRDMAGRDSLVMAATDGFKLAAAARPIPAGCEAWADCILPSRTVDLALAAHKLADAGDALILSQGGRAVEIAFGNASIYSQCVDATFPDWPRAFDSIVAPTDEEQGALFPDLLPHYPAGRAAEMEKTAPGAIDWQPGNGALIGASAADPGMVWAVMYLATGNAGLADPAPGFKYRTASEAVEVEVAGDRAYPVAINATATRIHLSKEQVAALCGDTLWNVLEFPGADGRPRYISQWLWDDGASRFLCVGKDGRCPKADAPREYVTRAEVEAALAGEILAPVMIEAPAPITVAPEAVSARQMPEERAEPIPAPTDSAEAPASDPTPVSYQPADDSDPIAAERGKRSNAERRAIIRAWQMRAAMRRMRAEPVIVREAAPAEVMADIAEAEAMIRGEGYIAPRPLSMREAFTALYRIARRDKQAGVDLLHAACDLTGEPHETFKCWRACRLHKAVTRALEAPEGMRYRLQRNVLNAWGSRNGLRSPAMGSPRFEGWRRVSCKADALRKRLADAGRLEYDTGNWVVRVLPLPVTPEPTPTATQASKRTPAHERAIRRAWAERKERRAAETYWESSYAEAKAEHWQAVSDCRKAQHKRRRAVIQAREAKQSARYFIRQSGAHYDRAINAEHEAREALAAREDLKRMLADAEARLSAADAENAQLWAEIETLTAPAPALAA